MNFKYVIYITLLFLISCDRYEMSSDILGAEEWDAGLYLSSANSVVYNDTLYVFFGRDSKGSDRDPSSKVYFADMEDLSQFTTKSLPIKPRVSAASVLIDDKLYLGLGFNGKAYNDTSILKDWHVYDFKTKKLAELSPFPFDDAVSPVVWCDSDNIYFALGFSTTFCRNVYKYNISEDRWSLISDDSPMYLRGGAVGALVEDKLFLGTGYRTTMMNDWWSFDCANGLWTKLSSVPTKGRIFSSVVPVGKCIYMLGGRYFGGTESTEHFYSDLLCYDTELNIWTVLGRMPQGGTENMIAFEYKGALYWGLGQQKNGVFCSRIYKYKVK